MSCTQKKREEGKEEGKEEGRGGEGGGVVVSSGSQEASVNSRVGGCIIPRPFLLPTYKFRGRNYDYRLILGRKTFFRAINSICSWGSSDGNKNF